MYKSQMYKQNENLLALIDKASRVDLQPFFAPVLDPDGEVLTIQEDFPFWFELVETNGVGWYQLEPLISPSMALVARPMKVEAGTLLAYKWRYITELSRMYVIVLFQADETTWMVSPFNISDALQRGWPHDIRPRPMRLVDQNVMPSQVVQVAMLGKELIYVNHAPTFQSQISGMAGGHAATLIEAYNIERARIETERARAERRKTAQGRVEESLEFMGAELESMTPNLTGYNVTWRHNGHTYHMEIDEHTRIDSSGVCLAGTDQWHSLASIVAVMEDRQRGWL